MTPEELAARHPRLYHLTLPGNLPGIERHGLLSTSLLLDAHEIEGDYRVAIERRCRPSAVQLDHPVYGATMINDQSPMSETALAKCLDGGLTPAEWLVLLNGRVFLWASERDLRDLLEARANRNRPVTVLILDTLRLARDYASLIEFSPINSGNTRRKPARRGLKTFSPLERYGYAEWTGLRGKRDRIREVTVLGGVPDISNYLVEDPITHRPV